MLLEERTTGAEVECRGQFKADAQKLVTIASAL